MAVHLSNEFTTGSDGPRLVPTGLILLVGPPASGKSAFATEWVRLERIDAAGVVSADAVRAKMVGPVVRVSDDSMIFAEMDRRVSARLAAGRPVVVDATNVAPAARARMLAHAGRHGRPSTALRFPVDDDVLLARNAARTGPALVPVADVLAYVALFRDAGDRLGVEGFDRILDVPGQADDVSPADAARHFFIG